MKNRYTEEQIIGFLKETDSGVSVRELCRKHRFSDASYYKWKAKFGCIDVSELRHQRAILPDPVLTKSTAMMNIQPKQS
jgi:putative transposase